jgi:hypothetical protein
MSPAHFDACVLNHLLLLSMTLASRLTTEASTGTLPTRSSAILVIGSLVRRVVMWTGRTYLRLASSCAERSPPFMTPPHPGKHPHFDVGLSLVNADSIRI